MTDWYQFVRENCFCVSSEVSKDAEQRCIELIFGNISWTKHQPERIKLALFQYSPTTGCIYGNKLLSKPTPLKNAFNSYSVYLISKTIDSSPIILIELLEVISKRNEDQVLGWTFLRLNKESETTNKLQLYAGGLRTFICLLEPYEKAIANHKIEACVLSVSTRPSVKLDGLTVLTPPNFLFDNSSIIPGALLSADGKVHARITKQCSFYVEEIVVSLKGTTLEEFESTFVDALSTEQVRLQLSTNIKISIAERKLLIFVHNGLRFLNRPKVLLLELDQNGQQMIQRDRIRVDNVALNDGRFALVFILQYVAAARDTSSGSTLNSSIRSSSSSCPVNVRWAYFAPFGGASITPETVQQLQMFPSGRKTPMLPDFSAFYQATLLSTVDANRLSMSLKIWPATALPPMHQTINNAGAFEQLVVSTPKSGIARGPLMSLENTLLSEIQPSSPDSRQPLSLEIPSRPVELQDLLQSTPAAPAPTVSAVASVAENVRLPKLTRAVSAYLLAAGFAPILDDNGQQAAWFDITESSYGLCVGADSATFERVLATEKSDRFVVNEIFFQFMAFELSGQINNLSSIVLSFQFYRFPAITSERLILFRHENMHSQHVPFIVKKADAVAAPGYLVSYNMNPSFLRAGESALFLDYLWRSCVHVDVFDGDSLHLVGSCSLPLRCLLRGGRAAIQTMTEIDIVKVAERRSMYVGRLVVKVANVGHPAALLAEKPAEQQAAQSNVVLAKSVSQFDVMRCSWLAGCATSTGHNVVRQRPKHLAEVLTDSTSANQSLATLPASRPNLDQATNRKLARMELLRRSGGALPAVNRAGDDSEKRFRIAQAVREQTKHQRLLVSLANSVTTEYVVDVSFGESTYFEFVLKHHSQQQQTVSISISSTDLKIIMDAREWRWFKVQTNLTRSPIEEGLILWDENKSCYQLLVRPNELVNIPFKYICQVVSERFTMTSGIDISGSLPSVTATFQDQSGSLVARLVVFINCLPHLVHKVTRYSVAENSFLKRFVHCPNLQGISTARASLPSVLCEVKPSGTAVNTGVHPVDVLIKLPVVAAPALMDFCIALYDASTDPFLAKPVQIWRFLVQACQQFDWTTCPGQLGHFNLMLRAGSCSRLVKSYSNDYAQLQLLPQSAIMLVPGAIHEFYASCRMLMPGRQQFVVNAVDVETRELMHCWLVTVNSELPKDHVVPMFDVTLHSAVEVVCKRVTYKNSYNNNRNFSLRTSRPDLLRFTEDLLRLQANEVGYINMVIGPTRRFPLLDDAYVYVNNESDQLEDMFLIKFHS